MSLWLPLALVGAVSAPLAATSRPGRPPLTKPPMTELEEGRSDARVIVKVQDGLPGTPTMEGTQIRPLFAALPKGRQLDLGRYFVVDGPPGLGPQIADAFNAEPWVELAYLAYLPQPPPEDIPPETPDFTGEQSYLGAPPDGMGVSEARRWPGGDGGNVAVADLEYAWELGHEDLTRADTALTLGFSDGEYAYHGNGVLGILFADDNDYGVTGVAPGADPVVIYPYDSELRFELPSAILAASTVLDAGDILLIEQQDYALGSYVPVEIDPAVFDAIAALTALGIVVVEPAANGYADLDDPRWSGWFDPTQRDSGAILVGGGVSPRASGAVSPRSWYPNGSCYGARVDVQGWYDHIVTTINDDSFGHFADLFFPDGDGRQAYTANFGGTSGASAQVAGLAALISSIYIELHGAPMDPLTLRALLRSTGSPQASASWPPGQSVGPQPDLRRLLRTAMLP